MSSWAVTLDDYEARLVAQRAALDAGGAGSLAPFVPPTDLGPLPEPLAERARRLLADAVDLEQELTDNVVALGHDLAVVRRVEASTATAPHARFVDISA
ncbi:MAG: hypothetical protein JWN67_4037 [Actinomycetia bacterium]|nr:hypothetical protein [Actinomycetes bacterium]